jgi:hypothetical protein
MSDCANGLKPPTSVSGPHLSQYRIIQAHTAESNLLASFNLSMEQNIHHKLLDALGYNRHPDAVSENDHLASEDPINFK